MSNKIRGPVLRGVILQGGQIVGGLELPEPHEPFVQQFAREYGALGLSVAPLEQLPLPHPPRVPSPTRRRAHDAAG